MHSASVVSGSGGSVVSEPNGERKVGALRAGETRSTVMSISPVQRTPTTPVSACEVGERPWCRPDVGTSNGAGADPADRRRARDTRKPPRRINLPANDVRPAIGMSVSAARTATPSAAIPDRAPENHQPTSPTASNTSIPTNVASPGNRAGVRCFVPIPMGYPPSRPCGTRLPPPTRLHPLVRFCPARSVELVWQSSSSRTRSVSTPRRGQLRAESDVVHKRRPTRRIAGFVRVWFG